MTHRRHTIRYRAAKLAATAFACTFVFGPPIAGILGGRATPMENRPLAKRPAITQGWDALDALAPWASDHLPGRNLAVHANAWVTYHAFAELPPAAQGTAGTHDPLVVRGRDGYLFLASDFYTACAKGHEVDDSLRKILDLARAIQASGRRALVVVPPDKSSVLTHALPRAVPRGTCATSHMQAAQQTLAATRDPLYLPLLSALRDADSAGLHPYWQTDSHWSPAGAAVYAHAVADRLSPGLASRLTTTKKVTTYRGDLSKLSGLEIQETSTQPTLSTGVVHLDPFAKRWVKEGVYYGSQHWTTTPGTGLIQGRTLLLGDSFGYEAVPNLRPLFADGTFVWTRLETPSTIAKRVAAADTVIIEVVQRGLVLTNATATDELQNAVAAALAPPR